MLRRSLDKCVSAVPVQREDSFDQTLQNRRQFSPKRFSKGIAVANANLLHHSLSPGFLLFRCIKSTWQRREFCTKQTCVYIQKCMKVSFSQTSSLWTFSIWDTERNPIDVVIADFVNHLFIRRLHEFKINATIILPTFVFISRRVLCLEFSDALFMLAELRRSQTTVNAELESLVVRGCHVLKC